MGPVSVLTYPGELNVEKASKLCLRAIRRTNSNPLPDQSVSYTLAQKPTSVHLGSHQSCLTPYPMDAHNVRCGF